MPINRSVRIVTNDGTRYNGRRLNEDTYTVQIVDENERLLSLEKDDLREYAILTESAMPSYARDADRSGACRRSGVPAHPEGDQPMTATTRFLAAMSALLIVSLPFAVAAPEAQEGGVTFGAGLLNAADEPHNWLTYSGNYEAQRHTALDQITPANVDRLELQWVFQARSLQVFQTTPLVVDGMMYLTEAPNTVYAVDAEHGRVFWRYEYTPSPESRPCCGRVNRGVAILGDTLFMGTIDAQLIAIDRISGQPIWQTAVERPRRRLRADACSAHRQGQGDRQRGGRRVRHPRLHLGLRRRNRGRGVEVLHDPRPRRAGP